MYDDSDNGFSDEDEEDMKIIAQTTKPTQAHSRGSKVYNGRDKYAAMHAPPNSTLHHPKQTKFPEIQRTPMEKIRRQGTREQVWNGSAERTKGGLTKDDLLHVPMGIDKSTGETVYKLVSKKRSENAKKIFGYGVGTDTNRS